MFLKTDKSVHFTTLFKFIISKLVFLVTNILLKMTRLKNQSPGFDSRSGHVLLFLLPQIQEGHLSDTG